MVILGNVELAQMDREYPDLLPGYLNEITRAAQHSRDITMQLLAFSRQQIILPKIVDANKIIAESRKALARLIGEDVTFTFNPAPDLWPVKIDPVQLDQIVMNMAVNARDAMPDGGIFTVETANVVLDEALCQLIPESVAGDYARLSFIDTGTGIDEGTLQNIFEPFFTTKEIGRGTGLGLATIYGIVHQNSGTIAVHSIVGSGTRFEVYLPRQNQSDEAQNGQQDTLMKGTETILLVEDDDAIRRLATGFLRKLGYTVLEAETPGKALAIAADESAKIDLVLSDVMLPEMNGVTLAHKIRQSRPGIKAIYASGYASDHLNLADLNEDMIFLQKPFSLDKLSECLKRAFTEDRGNHGEHTDN